MQTQQDQQWQRGDWAYTWNANGSLRSVKLPDGSLVEYEYDALGRRTKKIFNNKIIRYLWDNNVLLHQWEYDKTQAPRRIVNKLGEVSFDKPEPVQNLITWVYETGSFVPCAKIVGNETFSIINDYIGRPILAFNEKGEKVWETDYDIYGNLRNLKGERDFIPFRQLGQYEDIETGLYYNRFRYYNPETGLYISKDPIGLAGGLRLYSYVRDTNNQTDPLGLIIVYRALNSSQKQQFLNNQPILPKNSKANYSIQQHINNGKLDTQYISTTKKIERAEFYSKGKSIIIEIDTDKIVPQNVLDVSEGIDPQTGLPLKNPGKKWAKKDLEVLITDSIPVEAYKKYEPKCPN